eukprot:13456394-Heterocapsa_arctica.AAC.1
MIHYTALQLAKFHVEEPASSEVSTFEEERFRSCLVDRRDVWIAHSVTSPCYLAAVNRQSRR